MHASSQTGCIGTRGTPFHCNSIFKVEQGSTAPKSRVVSFHYSTLPLSVYNKGKQAPKKQSTEFLETVSRSLRSSEVISHLLCVVSVLFLFRGCSETKDGPAGLVM